LGPGTRVGFWRVLGSPGTGAGFWNVLGSRRVVESPQLQVHRRWRRVLGSRYIDAGG
jgi:hypothetical protein